MMIVVSHHPHPGPDVRRALRAGRRLTGAGAVALGVTALASAVAIGATGDGAVVATEKAGGAAAGAPDLTRVSLQRSVDGRLRVGISFAEALTVKDMVAASGPPGSACVRLYTSTQPGVLPPDYLVCATPDAKGKALRGTVLAEQVNALPKKVATAAVSRASTKSLVLRFSQSAVGKPSVVQFAAEATRAGCVKAGCVDTLPNAPKTAKLVLRLEAPPER